MEVKINEEIRNYTESMFFGLSLRQFIFSVLACGVAVGLFFLLRPHFGTETLSWVCILGAFPFAAMGFIKSYAAVCLEGAIIVLACIIFSLFAATPPAVNPDAAAVTMVWSYVGELVFNMLVLVGAVKMADRVVREMMGL